MRYYADHKDMQEVDRDDVDVLRAENARLREELAEAKRERDDYHDSAVAMMGAFPVDAGDWPVTDGAALVASFKKWDAAQETADDWGDRVTADTIVGIVSNLKQQAAKDKRLIAAYRMLRQSDGSERTYSADVLFKAKDILRQIDPMDEINALKYTDWVREMDRQHAIARGKGGVNCESE